MHGFRYCLPSRPSGGTPVIILLLLAVCSTWSHAAEPIKIGVIDAFSGPAAAFGEPALRGWKMAAEEVNAGGGIAGRAIEIVARDDAFSEDKALSAARTDLPMESSDTRVRCTMANRMKNH
ncbi:MAG: ABC transporter substrate-binding protein [Thermodesulfobacteriota bacterium]